MLWLVSCLPSKPHSGTRVSTSVVGPSSNYRSFNPTPHSLSSLPSPSLIADTTTLNMLSQFSVRLQAGYNASPTRLARVVADDLQNLDKIDQAMDTIILQCETRQSAEPFFRFIEAALSVISIVVETNYGLGVLREEWNWRSIHLDERRISRNFQRHHQSAPKLPSTESP